MGGHAIAHMWDTDNIWDLFSPSSIWVLGLESPKAGVTGGCKSPDVGESSNQS